MDEHHARITVCAALFQENSYLTLRRLLCVEAPMMLYALEKFVSKSKKKEDMSSEADQVVSVRSVRAREFQSFHISITSEEINRIAQSYDKKITRKSMFECGRDCDVNSNTGTPRDRIGQNRNIERCVQQCV